MPRLPANSVLRVSIAVTLPRNHVAGVSTPATASITTSFVNNDVLPRKTTLQNRRLPTHPTLKTNSRQRRREMTALAFTFSEISKLVQGSGVGILYDQLRCSR